VAQLARIPGTLGETDFEEQALSKITLHFQPSDDVDPAAAAKQLESALSSVPGIQADEPRVDRYRSIGPAEIIAGLTIAGALMRESTEVIQDFSKVVDAIRQAVESVKGLRAAFVEIGMRKVPLAQLTTQDLEILAKRASA
jgi:hypothetical protein